MSTIQVDRETYYAMFEALEFYAEQSNYHARAQGMCVTVIEDDAGTRAEYALQLANDSAIANGSIAHG